MSGVPPTDSVPQFQERQFPMMFPTVYVLSNGAPAIIASNKAEAVELFNLYVDFVHDEPGTYTEADIITVDEISTKDYEFAYDAWKSGNLFAVAC